MCEHTATNSKMDYLFTKNYVTALRTGQETFNLFQQKFAASHQLYVIRCLLKVIYNEAQEWIRIII